MKSPRYRRGFTLIELLIVVIIIGIIAAIALPRFTDVKKKAYIATISGDLRQLAGAEEVRFHADTLEDTGAGTYVQCTDISQDNLCDELIFVPSPNVKASTEIGDTPVTGWYGNARHAKLPSDQQRCANYGDTAAVAPVGGFDNSKAPNTLYACTTAY